MFSLSEEFFCIDWEELSQPSLGKHFLFCPFSSSFFTLAMPSVFSGCRITCEQEKCINTHDNSSSQQNTAFTTRTSQGALSKFHVYFFSYLYI